MFTLVIIVLLTFVLSGWAIADFGKINFSNFREAEKEEEPSNECSEIDYDYFDCKKN